MDTASKTSYVRVIQPSDSVLTTQEPSPLRSRLDSSNVFMTGNTYSEDSKLKAIEELGSCILELRPSKSIIAGGALTSIYTESTIRDLDYYVQVSSDSEETALRLRINAVWGHMYTLKEMAHNQYTQISKSVFSTVYQMRAKSPDMPDINIILTREPPQNVVNDFDFTVCQAYTDGEGRVHTASQQTIMDLGTKTLRIRNTNNLKASRLRKYIHRGFFPDDMLEKSLDQVRDWASKSHLAAALLKDWLEIAEEVQKIKRKRENAENLLTCKQISNQMFNNPPASKTRVPPNNIGIAQSQIEFLKLQQKIAQAQIQHAYQKIAHSGSNQDWNNQSKKKK